MSSLTRRILIIDDDPVIREFANLLLSAEGYVTMLASGGAQGIEMALRSRPDLVLCDLLMPEVDGFGVLARLRAEPATAGIPFIFITASKETGDAKVGFMLGADEYLTKPLDGDTLVAVVARRLASAASRGRFP